MVRITENATGVILAIGTFVLSIGLILIVWFSVITSLSGGNVNMPMVYLGVGLALVGGFLDAAGFLLGRSS